MRHQITRRGGWTRWAFATAVAAALLGGPTTAEVRAADPPPTIQGGSAILDPCVEAKTSVKSARAHLKERDPTFQAELGAALTLVQDSLDASARAGWPETLQNRRRKVEWGLSRAEKLLARNVAPAKKSRSSRAIDRDAAASKRQLSLVEATLEPLVVPEEDLTNVDPVPVDPVPPPPPPTGGAFAWTDLAPSTDSRVVYVSSSQGNDSNSGLSTDAPVQSVSRGFSLLRNGYPDWMLLRRGDTWSGVQIRISDMSGRSGSEPLVVGSYGAGTTRPRLNDSQVFGRGTSRHVAVTGLHFERVSTSSGYTNGVAWYDECENVLIEDCYFAGYQTNLVTQLIPGRGRNVKIRGCVVVDSYSTSSHSQGIFASGIDGLLIEGCVFDHNGWRESVSGAQATIFNHNMYIQGDTANVTVRGNISANASSHGLQQRAGGLCEDNLFLRNPINAFFGRGGTCRRNVALDGRDIGSLPRGAGIDISLNTSEPLELHDNIIAHQTTGTAPIGINVQEGMNDLYIHDNLIYNWSTQSNGGTALEIGGNFTYTGSNRIRNNVLHHPHGTVFSLGSAIGTTLTFSGNRYWSGISTNDWFRVNGSTISTGSWASVSGETGATFTAAQFSAPNRTIATYHSSVGGAASIDAFMAEARKQSRANWRSAYTAKAVNDYVRAGFDR